MDNQRFDQLTRIIATRRRGLRALVGGLIGSAFVVGETLAKEKAHPSECNNDRRCGDECCRPGFVCIFGRCQRTQNSCVQLGGACSSDGECCKDRWGHKQTCAFGYCADDNRPINAKCGKDWQCESGWCTCDDLRCWGQTFPYHTQFDTCEPPNGCRPFRASCGSNTECCSGKCRDGVCADLECKPAGELCEDDRWCCSLNCSPQPGGNNRCA